jgi:proteasome accessory factor B
MRQGRPAKKYSQAGRVHDVIRLIEARHGITLNQLVEETGVGRRTIQRDLNAIHEAGYPLTSEWQEGENAYREKVYRFLTRFKDVPPISFSLQELMTLSLLRTQLDLLSGTPFIDDLAGIFGKVNSVLPPRLAAHMERIAQVAHPLLQGRRDYSKSREALSALRHALLYQQTVTITYQVSGRSEPEHYRCNPYTLLFQKGGIYLMGWAQNRNALRTFAIERIVGVEPSKERFEIPENYHPSQALEGAFGLVSEPPMEVQVRFAPSVAYTIKERIWHPSQRIVEEPDGSLLLSFRAGGKLEILSWIMSYGPRAELLAPETLRRELGQLVRQTAELYQS